MDEIDMHTRSTDAAGAVHIGREIPLWGLVTAFVVFCLQAASVYYGQVSQGDKLTRVENTSSQINVKLDQVNAAQNTAAFKIQEHSYQILDIQTRLVKLENESQRQPSSRK